MFLLIVIGYAAITGALNIKGSANYTEKPFVGIYISNVSVVSSNGLSITETEYIKPTNLKSEVSVMQANASIAYEITVHNNSDITYWYHGIDLLPEYESNYLIGAADGILITTTDGNSSNSDSFDHSDWMPPHTERTFYAVYQFGKNAQGELLTLIKFDF